MDVIEFQKKLEEVCALAEKHQKILTGEQVRSCFADTDLDRGQLLKILQYMKSKGIQVEGVEQDKEEIPAEEISAGTSIPLTPQDKEYLDEYKKSLLMAKDSLATRYMPLAADLAAELNCEEIPFVDLIQEANVCLLMILEEHAEINEIELKEELRRGLVRVIEEQTERKQGDDALVGRVEKLESAVRELSDGDDEEIKFSIDELAIILDMDGEEIRDILRLTGDDK